MESLIRELIKLDKKAAAITLSAENNLQKLDATISEKKEAATYLINEALEKRLAEINEGNRKKIELKKSEIEANTNNKISAIKDYYKNNREVWADDLFNKIADNFL